MRTKRNGLFFPAVGFVCASVISAATVAAGPIHEAARAGDVARVQLLLGADPGLVDTVDNFGETPLFIAANHNQLEVARLLIGQHADVNQTGVMYVAAVCGNVDMVKLLLKAGGNPNGRAKHTGGTALSAVFASGNRGPKYLEIAQFLIDAGADVKLRDERGRSALDIAAENGSLPGVEFLTSHGSDPNDRSQLTGDTALHRAAENGFPDVVAALLVKGANPNAQNLVGNAPLHYAGLLPTRVSTVTHPNRSRDQVTIAELLINHGAEVNIRTKSGQPPLFYAKRTNSTELVLFLERAGAVD